LPPKTVNAFFTNYFISKHEAQEEEADEKKKKSNNNNNNNNNATAACNSLSLRLLAVNCSLSMGPSFYEYVYVSGGPHV